MQQDALLVPATLYRPEVLTDTCVRDALRLRVTSIDDFFFVNTLDPPTLAGYPLSTDPEFDPLGVMPGTEGLGQWEFDLRFQTFGGGHYVNKPSDEEQRREVADRWLAASGAQAGDILLCSHEFNLFGPGHAAHGALVVDPAKGRIIDSMQGIGVREVQWSDFNRGYSHMYLLRVRGVAESQRSSLITWAESHREKKTPYNRIVEASKSSEAKMYCFQFLWNAFQRHAEIDIDRDGGLLVAGNDILFSNTIDFVGVVRCPGK